MKQRLSTCVSLLVFEPMVLEVPQLMALLAGNVWLTVQDRVQMQRVKEVKVELLGEK